jgi:hypothetical protein
MKAKIKAGKTFFVFQKREISSSLMNVVFNFQVVCYLAVFDEDKRTNEQSLLSFAFFRHSPEFI